MHPLCPLQLCQKQALGWPVLRQGDDMRVCAPGGGTLCAEKFSVSSSQRPLRNLACPLPEPLLRGNPCLCSQGSPVCFLWMRFLFIKLKSASLQAHRLGMVLSPMMTQMDLSPIHMTALHGLKAILRHPPHTHKPERLNIAGGDLLVDLSFH